LVERAGGGGGRQLVAKASGSAADAGIRPGMTLGQARAIRPGVTALAYSPQADARALVALARWMTQYSPVVSPEPPDALFVDVGGCERLYGGLEAIVQRVGTDLAGMRVHANIGIAPNPGAAWAVASFAENGTMVGDGDLVARLAGLPVAALRLDGGTVAVLDHLGVGTVGQLKALPRDALPSRFGSDILGRLDAAMGRVAEPLVPVGYPVTPGAEMEFEGAVESPEMVELAIRELLRRLVPQLERHGLGAREVRSEFRRAYAPPVVRAVRLSKPSRDPATLFKLLRCVLDATGTDGGFVSVRLDVPVHERVAEAQWSLLRQEEEAGEDELARLSEVLRTRLGSRSLVRLELVAAHVPERAFRLVEGDDKHGEADGEVSDDVGPRPLHLLPSPVEVGVVASPSAEGEGVPLSFAHEGESYRLALADGPERIEGMWWEGRDKTRDYYDVEDVRGRRFWLFRVPQTGRWYLHGIFA
jgi:protein ImuB